jgi:uncharacterized protein (TIGR02757 family)
MKLSLSEIKDLLDFEANRINNPDFISEDPVQFPRRFEKLQDIEIVALLSSAIAWGNRKMICRNCEKMLSLMDYRPFDYVMDSGYEDLPDGNIHRTFFNKNFRYYLRGLHRIYQRYNSLQEFARAEHIADSEYPSWRLVEAINRELCDANGGEADSRCLPQNLDNTALKRINMAVRWLVRNDGIVDMGVWDVIKPSQLFIPLDVHVGNISRQLGLLERKTNDRRSVIELTQKLRTFDAEDPIRYDYALFGIGVHHQSLGLDLE